MKTLIIPDIHNHTDWAEIFLQNCHYDKVIFLGDYFDDFGDNEVSAYRTAMWLKGKLKHNNYIFLLGNHDASYRFPYNKSMYCPGFTVPKSNTINKILDENDWNKMQLCHVDQGFLYTHAGINKKLFTHPVLGINQEVIDKLCETAIANAKAAIPDPILMAGLGRGGKNREGGIIWQDWEEFKPISGINQILGHTPSEVPRVKLLKNKAGEVVSTNYCLDCLYRAVGIVEDGKLLAGYVVAGKIEYTSVGSFSRF